MTSQLRTRELKSGFKVALRNLHSLCARVAVRKNTQKKQFALNKMINEIRIRIFCERDLTQSLLIAHDVFLSLLSIAARWIGEWI